MTRSTRTHRRTPAARRSPRLALALAVTALAGASPAIAEPGDIPDRPPPLTFDKHVDYVAWYNDFVRRGRDEKDNAYHLYRKLCPDADGNGNGNGGIRPPEGKVKEQFDLARNRIWTADEFPELAAYLKECEPYMDTLREAAGRPACWVPANNVELLWDADDKTSDAAREAVKAWSCRLWMAPYRNADEVLEYYEIAMKFASHAYQTSMIIDGLSGMGCGATAYEQLLVAVYDGTVDPTKCKAVLKMCLRLTPSEMPGGSAILIEWTRCLDGLQWATERIRYDKETREEFSRLLKKSGSNESVDERIARVEALARFADQYYASIARIMEGGGACMKALALHREIEDGTRQLRRRPNLFVVFSNSLVRPHELALRVKALRRGALVALALNVHHSEHGRWPKSLTAIDMKLAIKDLPTLCTDPYSEKPFIYKLVDGQPLLYSVGLNGKDDGGIHHGKFGEGADGPADFVFWPPPKPADK